MAGKRMSRLLLDERCVVIQPTLVRALGRMSDAALLQQVHYWLPYARSEFGGHRWVYKTADDWADETGLSPHQVRRSFARLEALGVVLTCKPRAKSWNHRKWYRIDYNHPVLTGDDPASSNSQDREIEVTDSRDRSHDPAQPSLFQMTALDDGIDASSSPQGGDKPANNIDVVQLLDEALPDRHRRRRIG